LECDNATKSGARNYGDRQFGFRAKALLYVFTAMNHCSAAGVEAPIAQGSRRETSRSG